jgi:hypothetical protein
MPKTPVYKNDFTSRWEDNVGFSWKSCDVQPEAVAHAMDKAANCHLGFGVRTSNEAHARAALLRRERVH